MPSTDHILPALAALGNALDHATLIVKGVHHGRRVARRVQVDHGIIDGVARCAAGAIAGASTRPEAPAAEARASSIILISAKGAASSFCSQRGVCVCVGAYSHTSGLPCLGRLG